MNETDLKLLRAAIALAQSAVAHGNHPFGALLADTHGNVLLEAENTVVTERDCTGHAETNLVREAGRWHPREALSRCTLYASTEPCAMCAGAIFWSGVGRVVFALGSPRLSELMGDTPDQLLPRCADVLAGGMRRVEVVGPALEGEAEQVFTGFFQ